MLSPRDAPCRKEGRSPGPCACCKASRSSCESWVRGIRDFGRKRAKVSEGGCMKKQRRFQIERKKGAVGFFVGCFLFIQIKSIFWVRPHAEVIVMKGRRTSKPGRTPPACCSDGHRGASWGKGGSCPRARAWRLRSCS